MKRWASLLSFWTVALSATAIAGPSDSARNGIRSLDVRGEAGLCVVAIEGESKPTFTVFRLQSPLRLVLDVAGADFSRFESPRDVANGVVTQIVLAQYRDNARAFGRVMIGFERDVPYDVKVEGNWLKVILYATPVDLKKDLAAEREKVKAARREVADVRAELGVQVRRREEADLEARSALEKARDDERRAIARLAAEKNAETERRVAEAKAHTRLAEDRVAKAAESLKATALELARANQRAAEQAAAAERTRRERDAVQLALLRERREREAARMALLRERRERKTSEKERARREEELVARLRALEQRERTVTAATATEIRTTKEELARIREAAEAEKRDAALREQKSASRQRELEQRLVEAATREKALAAEREKVKAAQREVADVRAELAEQVRRREAADSRARAVLEKARDDERRAVTRLAAEKNAEAERLAAEARERTRAAEAAVAKAADNLKATALELARANQRAAERAAEAERTRRERDKVRSELERERREREAERMALERVRREREAARTVLERERREREAARMVLKRELREREASEKERARREGELVARLRALEQRERTVTAATATEIRATKEELAKIRATTDAEKRDAALREERWASRQRALEQRLAEAAMREKNLREARAKELGIRRAAEMVASRMAGRAANLEKLEREYGEAAKRLAEKDRELEATRSDLQRTKSTVDEKRRREEDERTRVRAEVEKLRLALGAQKVDATRVEDLKRQVARAEARRIEAEEARKRAEAEAATREKALEGARAKELEVRRAAEMAASQMAGKAANLEKLEREYGDALKRLADKDRELESTRNDLRRVMSTVDEKRRHEEEERMRVRADVEKLRVALGSQKVDSTRVADLKRQVAEAEALRIQAEMARRRAEAEAQEKGRAVDRIRGELVTQSAAVNEAKTLRDQAEATGHARLRQALRKSSKEKSALMARLDEAVSMRRRLESDAERAASELRAAQSAQAKLEVELSRERQRAIDVARAADAEKRARASLETENRAIRAELQKLILEKTVVSKPPVASHRAPDVARKDVERPMETKPASVSPKRDADLKRVVTRVASAEAEVPVVSRSRRSEPVREAVTGSVADLRVEEDGDGSRVVVETSGRLLHRFQRALPDRWILDLQGAHLPRSFERTLDASELPGGLLSVSAFTRREASVRIVVKVREGALPSLRVSPDRYFISVPPPDRRPGRAATIAMRRGETIPTVEARRLLFGDITTAGPMVSSGFGTERTLLAAATGQTARGRRGGGGAGPREDIRVNLALEDADLHRVLRLISDVVKLNFVVSDEVAGRVSILLKDVPWRTALDLILRSKGFGYAQKGNILRVAPLKVIDDERRMLEAASVKAIVERPPQVEIIPVSYAEPAQLQAQIRDVLTPRGTVAIDTRTNSLIVKDQVENLNRARRVVEFLDTQTPQILIEARIVEASTNFTRDFGIQWGGDISFSPSTGNPTGLSFPSRLGIAGGSGSSPTEGLLFGTPNYIVNLPVSAGLGAGGAIGISMGSLGGIANLSLRLSAAEENGTARIISAPKITTLDNQAATISQGVSIPYFSVGAAGASVALTNAALSLSVMPHVTADGGIRMQVAVTKNEPDFNTRGGGGNPAMNTRSATTNIWVRDGDTTVIAGIFTRNTGLSYKEIPLLAKIPILGWLFKNRTEKDIRQELLVFITPRIINRPATLPGAHGGSATGR